MGFSVRRARLAALLLAGLIYMPAWTASGDERDRRELRLASTIGPIDAGIVPALEAVYLKKRGVRVTHVGAGTGKALELARSGDFDLVMVHARALEDRFVAEGYGVDRRDVMYNDFVILGPEEDPAGIRGEKLAAPALARIARAGALFITRGDNSGTHVKEKEIWAKAGMQPAGPWYVVWEKGATGNAATTRYADERRAYVLMDRATYLTLKREVGLRVLVEGDRDLLNFIAVIRVNPARFPDVNAAAAREFVDWLVGHEAQRLIEVFGVAQYGEPLFFPNSEEWRATRGTR